MRTMLRFGVCALLAGAAASLGSAAVKDLPRPEKGKPFPGEGYTAPYEAVLDHGDVVLVGKVAVFRESILRAVEGQVTGLPGMLDLNVAKVLKGECAEKRVTIAFGGAGPWGLDDSDKPQVFLCLRDKDGKLALAGDPPEGGGFVREGPALVERLLEAAKDPKKGYESKDFAVKLSSAYRLAMAWAAAPADKKPTPPPGLIETLIDGLVPDADWRGRNVNAAARDAINRLLDCNITMMLEWSVYHGAGRREQKAVRVKEAWERTVKIVQDQRKNPNPKPDPNTMVQRRHAAEHLAKLESKDKNERIDAGRALADMGDVGLDALAAGLKSKNPDVAEMCRQLRRDVFENRAIADRFSPTFDPDLAAPFVPAEKAPASNPAAEKVSGTFSEKGS